MPQPTINGAPEAMTDFMTRQMWEGMELWTTGWQLWLSYLSALPTATTPAALMETNTRFLARALNMPGIATGALMKDAGLNTPTLSDA